MMSSLPWKEILEIHFTQSTFFKECLADWATFGTSQNIYSDTNTEAMFSRLPSLYDVTNTEVMLSRLPSLYDVTRAMY